MLTTLSHKYKTQYYPGWCEESYFHPSQISATAEIKSQFDIFALITDCESDPSNTLCLRTGQIQSFDYLMVSLLYLLNFSEVPLTYV